MNFSDRDRFRRVDHAAKVAEFYEMIDYEPSPTPGYVNDEVIESIVKMLREELEETEKSVASRDAPEIVDGLADLAFVAIGGLWKLGIDPDAAIGEVCRSNLTKEPAKTDRLQRDAVKGPDYSPPAWIDGAGVDEFAGEPVRIPPILVEAARLRQSKARDYMSGGVTREDYNSFGIASYAHNVIEKAMRVKSLTSDTVRTPNHESLRDTLIDMINFASFFVEYLDEEEVDR